MIFSSLSLFITPFLSSSVKSYWAPISSAKLAYFLLADLKSWGGGGASSSSKSSFRSSSITFEVTALTYDKAEVALELPCPM
jgi:hypothetical protein